MQTLLHLNLILFCLGLNAALAKTDRTAWQEFVGVAGPTGWRVHVIQPDPQDDGPDGINVHDWDGDGQLDVLVNYEEGAYSRLYFNPGSEDIRELWEDSITFQHGKCEDSGIGDLDNDGDMDYIANGGWVFFNPGTEQVREAQQWQKMTLTKKERRVPRVIDMNGDGLQDLLVHGEAWYEQPQKNKTDPRQWKQVTLGENRWPMNAIFSDVDFDGDKDLIVPDRGADVTWYENPGAKSEAVPWRRHVMHPYSESMFMQAGDLNGDGLTDFAFAGGVKGRGMGKLFILLRKNQNQQPQFHEVILQGPEGLTSKGVDFVDLEGDHRPEILVMPKFGDMWLASYKGDPFTVESWSVKTIPTPGAETRLKMDNAYLADIDADGDMDVLTTEENSGWGVIWFENPGR